MAAELDSPPSFEEDALVVVVVVVVVVVLVLVAVAVAVRDRRGGEDGCFLRFRGFLVGARKAGRRREGVRRERTRTKKSLGLNFASSAETPTTKPDSFPRLVKVLLLVACTCFSLRAWSVKQEMPSNVDQSDCGRENGKRRPGKRSRGRDRRSALDQNIETNLYVTTASGRRGSSCAAREDASVHCGCSVQV